MDGVPRQSADGIDSVDRPGGGSGSSPVGSDPLWDRWGVVVDDGCGNISCAVRTSTSVDTDSRHFELTLAAELDLGDGWMAAVQDLYAGQNSRF